VEGEIGDIGSGSEIHDAAPRSAEEKDSQHPPKPNSFVDENRKSILWLPPLANMHGMLRSMVAGNTKKRLDIERIRESKKLRPGSS